jgi:hypothetical protein
MQGSICRTSGDVSASAPARITFTRITFTRITCAHSWPSFVKVKANAEKKQRAAKAKYDKTEAKAAAKQKAKEEKEAKKKAEEARIKAEEEATRRRWEAGSDTESNESEDESDEGDDESGESDDESDEGAGVLNADREELKMGADGSMELGANSRVEEGCVEGHRPILVGEYEEQMMPFLSKKSKKKGSGDDDEKDEESEEEENGAKESRRMLAPHVAPELDLSPSIMPGTTFDLQRLNTPTTALRQISDFKQKSSGENQAEEDAPRVTDVDMDGLIDEEVTEMVIDVERADGAGGDGGSLANGKKQKRAKNKGGTKGKRKSIFDQEETINSRRMKVLLLIQHPHFDKLVLVLIFFSSLLLVIDSPLANPEAPATISLAIIDFFFTLTFTVEAGLKIYALGCSYLRSGWNQLDLFIVSTGLLTLALAPPMWMTGTENNSGGGMASIRALRTLRALRPLRAISRNSGLKLVVCAVMDSLVSVMELVLIFSLICLIFSIICVSYLKGAIGECHPHAHLADILGRAQMEAFADGGESGSYWGTLAVYDPPYANIADGPNRTHAERAWWDSQNKQDSQTAFSSYHEQAQAQMWAEFYVRSTTYPHTPLQLLQFPVAYSDLNRVQKSWGADYRGYEWTGELSLYDYSKSTSRAGGASTVNTATPTATPTGAPTDAPTDALTDAPTDAPTATPTNVGDTHAPTSAPTDAPTAAPTAAPTDAPSTANMTANATNATTYDSDGYPAHMTSRAVCGWLGGSWGPTIFERFDNVPMSMLTLYAMTTTEGWTSVMYAMVDQNGIDMQPIRDRNPWWALMPAGFVLVGAFFMLNLFVAVVIDAFNKTNATNDDGTSDLLTPEQQEWVKLQSMMLKVKPSYKTTAPWLFVCYPCWHLVVPEQNAAKLEMFVMALIVLNTGFMAANYMGISPSEEIILEQANVFFCVVFGVEMLIKMFALGFRPYMRDSWNRFDAFITVAALIAIIVQGESTYSAPLCSLQLTDA